MPRSVELKSYAGQRIKARSLRIALVSCVVIIVLLFVVVFFFFLFFLVWFSSKVDFSGYRRLSKVRVGAFRMYSAHVQYRTLYPLQAQCRARCTDSDSENFMRILKAGGLYFLLVFGAGFVLGTIRTLWVVPRLGTRMAELLETPIMFVVTILAARWIVLRLAVPPTRSARFGMGAIGFGLLLVAEFGLVHWLRGLSIREYLATRDPVSGTVYYVMLGVFAAMPFLVAKK